MKTKVNKSEKIRSYIGSHPDAGPKSVAEALKAKGIKVTPGHVSVIKHKMTSEAGKKIVKVKAVKVKAKPLAPVSTTVTENVASFNGHSRESLVEAIMQAESLVKYAGDLNKAKEFLDLISRL